MQVCLCSRDKIVPFTETMLLSVLKDYFCCLNKTITEK